MLVAPESSLTVRATTSSASSNSGAILLVNWALLTDDTPLALACRLKFSVPLKTV